MLVLVVVHPGAAVGAGRADVDLATSVGHTRPGRLPSRVDPALTKTPAPSPLPPFRLPHPDLGAARGADPDHTSGDTARVGQCPRSASRQHRPSAQLPPELLGFQYDDSLTCVGATLQAIANGRSHEGLPPMVLPSQLEPAVARPADLRGHQPGAHRPGLATAHGHGHDPRPDRAAGRRPEHRSRPPRRLPVLGNGGRTGRERSGTPSRPCTSGCTTTARDRPTSTAPRRTRRGAGVTGRTSS